MYTPYQPYNAQYAAAYPFPNVGQPVPGAVVPVAVAPGGNIASAGSGSQGTTNGIFSPPPVPPATPGALCCALVQSHRAIVTHWETQVNAFMAWLAGNGKTVASPTLPDDCELVLRLTTTITYGRECGVMEYAAVRTHNGGAGVPAQYTFVGVAVNVGSAAGFVDRCAFKNYVCPVHKLNFQLDLYRVKRG